MIVLDVNGKRRKAKVSPDTPLLWVLRDHLGLTGTKYGCGEGECGACSVLIDGRPEFACQVSSGSVAGKKITTIEGIPSGHPVKRAWIAEEVSQCGYCQPGQVVRAVALLERESSPDDAAIDRAMAPVLCRCGTYPRIRKAIRRAAGGAGTE